ncbi:uncharacterized protein LOC131257312 [Magnolia sinica]|uniref:uncharacterized protein LOC131257312 n=1 Tax=Magnolia sinica TaxID=86752 RepID=UPI002658CA75|nr:uncharacterized protein LOC131257312 [Magnolia sinica]
MDMKMGLVFFLVFSLLFLKGVSAIRNPRRRPTSLSPVQTDHIGSSSIGELRLEVDQILKRDQARVEYLNKRIKAGQSKAHMNTSTGSMPSVDKQDQTDLKPDQHQGKAA